MRVMTSSTWKEEGKWLILPRIVYRLNALAVELSSHEHHTTSTFWLVFPFVYASRMALIILKMTAEMEQFTRREGF